uniref:Uncharacterized protein n=1 Tax=Strigamia maritima TaxID=126957 RepID=T1JL50_STRMM
MHSMQQEYSERLLLEFNMEDRIEKKHGKLFGAMIEALYIAVNDGWRGQLLGDLFIVMTGCESRNLQLSTKGENVASILIPLQFI